MNNHVETIAVRKVIEDYKEGAFKADIEKLKSVFHKDAVMNGYLGPNAVMGTPAPFIEDIASAPSMESNGDNFQGEIESIHIEGNVASVVFSETGFRGEASLVDFFHLIKDDGKWYIISKAFTTV